MSALGRWTYVTELTFWPVTYDTYSQPVFGTPYIIMGDWAEGGQAIASDSGVQFVPTSRYWFELADGSPLMPGREFYVMRGDHTAEADPIAAGAEQIKKVGGWNMMPFKEPLPDWIVYT